MRNLEFLNRGVIAPVSQLVPDLGISASVFDPVTNSLTVALGPGEFDGSLEILQYEKTGKINTLAFFQVEDPNDRVVSFSHFSDLCQLILVFERGEIFAISYDPSQLEDFESNTVEIVGSVEDGVFAAEWSPDEEILVLATKANNIVLLSRQFEPISERKMTSDDINQSKHVDVGWGKRETQFKGRGAKAVERQMLENLRNSGLKNGEEIRDPTLPATVDKGTKSQFDNGKVSISWRGDCQYFAVSTLQNLQDSDIRLIRIFDREGNLDGVSEPVNGVEGNLSWKPQGSLIAATQRKDPNNKNDHTVKDILINPKFMDVKEVQEDLDLIFFERNGLRHGEFSLRLPLNTNVQDICWNGSSEVLAIVLDKSVQLWTCKNYHWYLKQEIFPTSKESDIIYLKWHQEKNLTFMLATETTIEIIDLNYTIISGPTVAPTDMGMTAVIDGKTVNITPLAISNVPPPMAFRELKVDENVNSFAISKNNNKFAVLSNNSILFAKYSLKAQDIPNIVSKLTKDELYPGNEIVFRQVCFCGNRYVGVLVDNLSNGGMTNIIIIDLEKITEPKILTVLNTPMKVILMRSYFDYSCITFECVNSTIFKVDVQDLKIKQIGQLAQLCYEYSVIEHADSSKRVVFGLTAGGRFYANRNEISSAVTSFKVTKDHLLFTTAQHQLRFVHLNNDFDVYKVANDVLFSSSKEAVVNHNNNNEHTVTFEDERIRAIERGSLLVSVSPSHFLVVLQAPRGNLETIYPRIMVLSDIRKNIKLKNYRQAFITCRTHRIDLDILHDYDPELFYNNLEHFIVEISKEDYLNLFIGTLHSEDTCKFKYRETANISNNETKELVEEMSKLELAKRGKRKQVVDGTKINKICKSLLTVLLKPEFKNRYMKSIITAYASQSPANTIEALKLISGFSDEDEKDKSIEYLCFLQDVNELYNTSLGLYDIPLTLLIAQKSQKDPKEYLPFLQNLYEQEELRKEFMIDDYLKRYESALDKLYLMEQKVPENSELRKEFDDYMIAHNLFKKALKLNHYNEERCNQILAHHADALVKEGKHYEAALVFEMLGSYSKAVDCNIIAKNWKNCVAIIKTHKDSFKKEDLEESSERLVENLSDARQYQDAALIEFKYLNNIEEAIKLYCKDYRFDDAILLATENDRNDLVKELVEPLIGESFGIIAELVSDCKSQIDSQIRRLRELRKKKSEDPYAFFGLRDANFDTGNEGDIPDDVSVAASETSTKESFFTRYTGKTRGTAMTGASRRTAKNRRREERKKARGKKGTIYEEEYLIGSVGRLHDRLKDSEAEAKRLIEGLIRLHKIKQAYEIQKSFTEVLQLLQNNIAEVYSMTEDDRTRINEQGDLYLIDIIPTPVVKDFEGYAVLDY